MNTTTKDMTETTDTTKRPSPISYRPLDEAELRRQAAVRGLSVNAYINHKVFGKKPRLPVNVKNTAAEITALQHLTDALRAFDPLTISDPLIAEQLADLLERCLEHNSRRTIALLRDAGWRP